MNGVITTNKSMTTARFPNSKSIILLLKLPILLLRIIILLLLLLKFSYLAAIKLCKISLPFFNYNNWEKRIRRQVRIGLRIGF